MDRLSVIAGKDVQGMVMRVDLNSRPLTAVPALTSSPPQFRPHGMSLYIGPDGERRLFVINHGAKRGVETWRSPHMRSRPTLSRCGTSSPT